MDEAEQLRSSLTEEGRFSLLVDAVTDYAICMLDPDGIVTSWNAGAQRIEGYEASEIVGQHFQRFYTERDQEAGLPARALRTALREGKFEGEGWHLRKDGTAFWTHVVIDPIREPSGRLVGFAKITHDLSERKFAEDALRRSEQQFTLLVQGVTDYAIYMLDPSGRVSSWNPGAERIKGYSATEIIGQHFSRFYTEEDRARGEPQRGLETSAREGRFEKEGWRVRRDGTRFWANIVIDAIRDQDGTLLGFAKVTRDITERKEAQEALEHAREALFQAQKLEAIGQLTGGIAHDFNNLLTAVLGSLELLRKRLPAEPRILGLLENAIQAAQRGATLTQRLLSFARRQEMRLVRTDLGFLVRGMADLLHSSVGPSIEIETRFPPSLDPVLVDVNQLESALLNLAVNARDAMPDGGTLVIRARAECLATDNEIGLEPGRYVCLSMADTGEGMDEATLTKAREPFFTTKGVGKGTGLGLSMVHGMAEQFGGRLALRSRRGEGTTAELWFPVTAAPSEAGDARAVPPPRPDAPVRSLVILAVDDDSLVLMNTGALLEDLGHTVLEATSGRQALDILQQAGTVDLVITDQAMPQMTGIQLAEAIRASRPGLPVILATGYAELPAGAEGGFFKLSKPFRGEDLARAIAQAVRPA
jgi:PAS domain S-box-containing protein